MRGAGIVEAGRGCVHGEDKTKKGVDKMSEELRINERVKNYLQYLSREYVFPYRFSGEKYGLVNELNILDRPVLILGPENDEKYKGRMRVWAYGGSIAEIDTATGRICLKGTKDYAPYLRDGFYNGEKIPEAFLQEGLFDKANAATHEATEERYDRLVKEFKKEKQEKIDPELLNLCVFSAYTRFLSRKQLKTIPTYPQEKSMQCVIAKNSMLNSRWKKSGTSMVVIDVETHLPAKEREHPRADFVVFDGESFGLIEFKYLGKSMDGKDNNLKKHYDDFAYAMSDDHAGRLYRRLQMKLQYLMDYGIIDQSWYTKGEEKCKKPYKKSVLWCGFYFLGDVTDIPGEKHTKKIVRDRIEKQLKDEDHEKMKKVKMPDIGHSAGAYR